MPSLTDATKRNKSSAALPSLAVSRTRDRDLRSSSSGSGRNHRESPDVTPRRLTFDIKAPSSTGNDIGARPATSESEQRDRLPVYINSEETKQEDGTRLAKRWSREKRTENKASARGFDGPILWPKAGRNSSPLVSHGFEPFSYAQAAASVVPHKSHTTIRVASASEIAETSKPRGVVHPEVSLRCHTAIPILLKFEDSSESFSKGSPSIFDPDSDDEHDLSDTATEVSYISPSGRTLPPDLNADDRLLNPQEYFEELEDLEASVVGNSSLFLMSQSNRQAYPTGSRFALKFGFDCHDPFMSEVSTYESHDEKILEFCSKHEESSPIVRSSALELSADLAYWSFHVLECRNIMLAVTANIKRMRLKNYCDTFISILTLDKARNKVAKLVQIQIVAIDDLHETFESALNQVLPLLESARPQRSSRIQDVREKLSRKTSAILTAMDLPGGSSSVGTWRRTVMMLDLAIISYSGAHQQRFDHQYLNGESLDFATINPAWTYDLYSQKKIMIRSRRLQCLDGLLQSPVWVFQSSSAVRDNSHLLLSTEMKTFADIWGPVWAVSGKDDQQNILEHRVGLGSIMPWNDHEIEISSSSAELCCHWSGKGEKTKQRSWKSMQQTSRLLIGAASGTQVVSPSEVMIEKTTSGLKENPTCQNKPGKVLHTLRSMHCLEEFGTSADERYLAGDTVTAQFGYSGIQIGGQRTWKRRQGVNLKQAIYEEWTNSPTGRNASILEQWIGLEVSSCNGNARRRRLKDILNSTTMRNYVESCKTSSDEALNKAAEEAFHYAIGSSDVRAFRNIYEQHREWRKDLGQLLAWCFGALVQSKVDHDGSLHVLWMPHSDERHVVSIKQKRHAWTSFLSDSREHCAMSVMSDICLQTDYKDASACRARNFPHQQRSEYSVLETALVINDSAPRPKTLSRSTDNNRVIWKLDHVQSGDKLRLRAGRLTIREAFRKTRLLVEWEMGIAKKLHEATKSMVNRVGIDSSYHWELRKDEESNPKPIPLFIISQNKDK